MSDQDNSPLEFSALDLMPDWAQDSKSDAKKPSKKKYADDRSPRKGGRGGGNFERRGGARNNNRGGGGDRRGGGNNRGRDNRGGGRDFQKDGRNRRDQESRLKGKVTAKFEPTSEAIDSLAKHIQETARAFPVASLAKMVAGTRERYQIRLQSGPKGPDFFRCKSDGSVWLTKQEAIGNLIGSKKLIEQFYQIDEVELEAPKGNFAQIAVCGFSGEILGPPNHHEYQSTLARIHREKFSNMTLERYKQRIQMESGEEVIAQWQEKVSKAFHYRLKSLLPKQPVVVEPEPEAVETPAPEPEPEAVETEVETTTVETEVETTEPAPTNEEAEAASPAEEEATPEPAAEEKAPEPVATEDAYDGPILKSIEELERHFSQNYADKEIRKTKNVVVSGNVPGKKLSPDVLLLIKNEGNLMRRGFPKDIFQGLCNKLDKGHSLKFFKRGKKALHVAMVRPREIPENLSLTDRLKTIITMAIEKPGVNVFDVLESLCPNFKRPEGKKDDTELQPLELDDDTKAVLGDIRWLATEGYLIEFPDSRLEIGRKPTVKLPPGVCTFTIGDLKKRKKRRSKKKTTTKSAKPSKAESDSSLPEGISTFVVE